MKTPFLLFLFCFGCSEPRPSALIHDAAPPPCEDDNPARLTDPRNCGSCGTWCETLDSDRCVNGECWCGTEPACTGAQDCRFGRCIQKDETGEICEFDEDCAATGLACIDGQCTRVDCVPEECDGYDNDCNGIIDDFGGLPLSKWCWNSPELPETIVLSPPCQRGVSICSNGVWSECRDSIEPVEESTLFACDGIDNDCDGCIDSTRIAEGYCQPISYEGLDVLFLLDVSGSMEDEIELLREALIVFSGEIATTENRFGIVLFPAGSYMTDFFMVASPLTNYETFLDVMNTFDVRATSSTEPSYDAFVHATNDSFSERLGWREHSSRITILLSDEEGQSLRTPRPRTETEMCEEVNSSFVMAVLGSPSAISTFGECVPHLLRWNVESGADYALELLRALIQDPCS
jgi:hypothetical protein